MGTGMVLRPIIPKVGMSWPRKLAELPLAIPASDPVKLLVDFFGGLVDDFMIDESVCCFVVFLNRHLWLRMAQIFECLVHGDCCFGIQK